MSTLSTYYVPASRPSFDLAHAKLLPATKVRRLCSKQDYHHVPVFTSNENERLHRFIDSLKLVALVSWCSRTALTYLTTVRCMVFTTKISIEGYALLLYRRTLMSSSRVNTSLYSKFMFRSWMSSSIWINRTIGEFAVPSVEWRLWPQAQSDCSNQST